MRKLRFGTLASLLLGLSITALAQTSAKQGPTATGSVSGEVSCADTNAPARFAVVTLEPVPAAKSDSEKTEKKDKHESGVNATATTDLAGRFELDKVPVGRYYVLGGLEGYLNPLDRFDPDQLKVITEETQKELARLLPVVDIEPGQAAAVTLRLERAAEVNGTILYDDGSPAVGLQIRLLRKDKDGKLLPLKTEPIEGLGIFGSNPKTDDRGHFRVIGMPAAEYAVKATLPSEEVSIGGLLGSSGISVSTRGEQGGELSVFSGSVFRQKDAKTTKVGDGEQVSGLDITIPLAGLHTVRGVVTAKRDGHPLSLANVELLFADDMESARTMHMEDEDGNFVLAYVPEEKYILRVTGGSDTEKIEHHEFNSVFTENKVIRKYSDAEMPLLVQGDVSGVELAAPDVPVDKVAQRQ